MFYTEKFEFTSLPLYDIVVMKLYGCKEVFLTCPRNGRIEDSFSAGPITPVVAQNAFYHTKCRYQNETVKPKWNTSLVFLIQ